MLEDTSKLCGGGGVGPDGAALSSETAWVTFGCHKNPKTQSTTRNFSVLQGGSRSTKKNEEIDDDDGDDNGDDDNNDDDNDNGDDNNDDNDDSGEADEETYLVEDLHIDPSPVFLKTRYRSAFHKNSGHINWETFLKTGYGSTFQNISGHVNCRIVVLIDFTQVFWIV